MKKIILSACLLASCGIAKAEDVLSIVPFTAYPNQSMVIDEDEETVEGKSFDVNISYSKDYVAVEYLMYVPEALTFTFSADYSVQPGENCPVKKSGAMYHGVTFQESKTDTPIAGYKCYKLSATHQATTPKALNAGESGESLFHVYYTAGNIADGVYPILVRNIKLIIDGVNTVLIPAADTYCKVGNPKNQSFAPTGMIPTFINAAIANDEAISELDLTNVTSAEEFTYSDGHAVVAPTADFSTKLNFKRAAGATTYSSLCLPFAADVKCYTLESAADGNAHFVESTTAPAGKSVLVDGKTAIDVTTTGKIIPVENKTIEAGFYVKGDKLYSVNGTAKVPACKGYWTEGAGSNMRIVIDGVTGIEEATIDANETTFDLQGRRVVNANNGLYIVNGKKQIVK